MTERRFLAMGVAAGLLLPSACEPPMLPDIDIPEGGFTSAGAGTFTGQGSSSTNADTSSSTTSASASTSTVGAGGSDTSGAATGNGTGGESTAGPASGTGGAGIGGADNTGPGAGGAGGGGGASGAGGKANAGGSSGAGGSAVVVDAGSDVNRVDTGVTEDPRVAVAVLDGWRYEFPCGYVDGHTLATCSTGEICWPNATKARFAEKKIITMAGDATKIYEVVLRIRGAIEPRDYPVACMRVPGSPSNTIGIATQCDGFANQQQVTFNVWEFKIADPPQVFYLNSVPVHPPHRVDPIDMQFTVRVRGRSSITFTLDDLNGGEIRNCSIVVAGIPPFPNPFDGNFFQLNIVSAKIVP